MSNPQLKKLIVCSGFINGGKHPTANKNGGRRYSNNRGIEKSQYPIFFNFHILQTPIIPVIASITTRIKYPIPLVIICPIPVPNVNAFSGNNGINHELNKPGFAIINIAIKIPKIQTLQLIIHKIDKNAGLLLATTGVSVFSINFDLIKKNFYRRKNNNPPVLVDARL